MHRLLIFLLWVGLLSSSVGNLWGESDNISEEVKKLNQIIIAGQVEHAQSAIDSLPASLNEPEKQAIVQTLNRQKTSGDWIVFLKALEQKFPSEPHFTFILARTYWRAGMIEDAIQNCQKALQINAKDPLLLYQCAALAQTAGHTTEAKQWLEELLSLNPRDSDGLFLLARIYAKEGQVDQAEPLLLRSIKANPKHYLAYYELGRLKNQTKDYAEAEINLQKSVHFYPFFREAYNALLVAFARQKKQSDINKLKSIIDHLAYWDASQEERLRFSFFNPSQINPKLGYELAVELCFVKRYDLARKYLERVTSQGQTNEPFLFLLSQLRFRDGEYAACLTLLKQLKHPRSTESQAFAEQKAWSLFKTGDIDGAQSFLSTVLPKFPESNQLTSLAKQLKLQEKTSTKNTNPNIQKNLTTTFLFVDATEKAGLNTFKHVQGNPDKRWIIDVMGSGVAVADYDNDGDDDIYFLNAQPDVNNPQPSYRNALFRNDGGRFVDITDTSGVGDEGYGMCAVFGDVNNDRLLDLFVGNYGSNAFYQNNGDGTFTKMTDHAGLGDPGYAAGACFADLNNDGWLDLFVGNYIYFDPKIHGEMRDHYHGIDVFTGPLAFPSQEDRLYINNGDGTFKETGKQAGINVSEGRTMGCSVFDFDDDGYMDLYVSNDSTYNHLLRNRGDGEFEDISFVSGGAFNESGVAGGSMGVSQGDFNNDGKIDLLVTAYEQMSDILYQNDGDGFFSDMTSQWGLYTPSHWLITWGSGFCDFDSDGWLDLYTANGHIYPQINDLGLNRRYQQGISIYQNTGEKFIDVSSQSFNNNAPIIGGRGSALLDYDLDGDMDIVINCVDSTPFLLENQTPQRNWLKVTLDVPSAKCFGVKITAQKGEKLWSRLIDGGSSYLSQNSQTIHFGFGKINSIDRLTIHWIDQEPQIIPNPSLNQHLKIH